MPSKLALHLVPLLPMGMIVLLAIALLAVLVHGCMVLRRKQIPPRWVGILAGLRVAIVLIFVLLLLQPVFSFTRSVSRLPEMLVLVDTSESMSQPGAQENMSRLEELKGTLTGSGLASELDRRFKVRWFGFDRGAVSLDAGEWKSLEPAGDTTRFADGLTIAWNYPRPDGPTDGSAPPPPERVLLLSDGLDRGSPDLVEAAQRLGVPVDVLIPGSPLASKQAASIAIADVQAARRILLGSESHFLVILRCNRSAAERKVKVHIAEGGKDLESAEVTLRPGRTEERVRLIHRPTEAGLKRFEFRVTEMDQPAETPFALSVQVIDGKHEVLVLEDTWRWEFKFLRRVLEEDPSFRFTALLSRGAGAFLQFAAPDRRAQLVGFPQNRGQLAGFDTVILGDVNPKRWPRDLAGSIRHLVAEEGKSLIVVAGPNLSSWMDTPELLSLLPVEISKETGNPVTGPIPMRISPDGVRSAFFFQPGGSTGPMKLPALDQIYPPLRKNPQATVLLEAANLGNSYGPLIVMAEQTIGRGRVLFIGADTIWKWQTLTTAADANTTPYHQFWHQTFRALAPTRPGSSGVNLWLQPMRSRYEAGQRVAVRAEIDANTALPHATVQGVLSLPDGRSTPLSFTLDPTTASTYQTEFLTEKPGAYRVTATVVSEGKNLTEGATLVDVDEARPEKDGAPVDVVNLMRIAASTGGTVLDPANPESWPVSAGQRAVIAERSTVDLWNRGFLLVILALVAGTDWLLRLLRGYV